MPISQPALDECFLLEIRPFVAQGDAGGGAHDFVLVIGDEHDAAVGASLM